MTRPATAPCAAVEFDGIVYRRYEGRRYYVGYDPERKIKVALHRAVYEASHGPITAGWHVHHIDHDTDNNAPENLDAQPQSEHLSHHGREDRSTAHRCEGCGTAFVAGRTWGVRWCSSSCKERHYRQTARYSERRTCAACQKPYLVASKRNDRGQTCSRECQELLQHWDAKCEHCGEPFVAKRKHARFCSGRCKQRARKELIGAGT